MTVFALDVAGDRINPIWAVRNLDKIRPWGGGLTRLQTIGSAESRGHPQSPPLPAQMGRTTTAPPERDQPAAGAKPVT